MADDLWARVRVGDEFRPWICIRCGASVTEGPAEAGAGRYDGRNRPQV